MLSRESLYTHDTVLKISGPPGDGCHMKVVPENMFILHRRRDGCHMEVVQKSAFILHRRRDGCHMKVVPENMFIRTEEEVDVMWK